MRLPGWIRHDIGLKVAALALAVFLWVIVAERREVELTVDLPLRYTDMPADMIFTAEVPHEAKARIRGKGKFLRWRLDNVYFRINLSVAGEGIVTHVVSSGEAEIPPDKEIEVLEVLEPKAIRVELDQRVTREIPVGIRLEGEVPGDKVMIGRARSDPPPRGCGRRRKDRGLSGFDKDRTRRPGPAGQEGAGRGEDRSRRPALCYEWCGQGDDRRAC